VSAKVKGLWRNPFDYIMKWDDDRLWYTTPGSSSFTQVWEDRDFEGWSGEHELEGAALVAPLNILFWEKE